MKEPMKIALLLAALCACAGAASAAPDVKFLAPAPQAVLDAPAATVTLQFPENSRAQLWVNGASVPDAQVGRSETDPQTHLTTQTWYGVALKRGPNTLAAQATLDGVSGARATEDVGVRGEPQTLSLKVGAKKLAADGRGTVSVVGQLLDRWGNPAGDDGIAYLDADGGKWLGANADPQQPGFHVLLSHGRFTATLRAGTRSQAVHILSQVGAMRATAQTEFVTDMRPSLVTGVVNVHVGKGRLDYDRPLQDFLEPGAGGRDKSNIRVSSSGFGTGVVGQTLVTGAFNSDHSLNQTFNGAASLGRDTQVQDQQYGVYGDSSEREAQAQSSDHTYLRLERDGNYALWGDYGTPEFASRSQQLTSVSRVFHAFKTNLNFGALQATGFYGNDVQGFQRDALVPDGTGGYYFLSHRPLVYGSETISIELDDLLRPGVPVSVTPVSRGTDYEIDYDRGTLLFHQPLLRTDVGDDGRVLERRIVVTYQYQTTGRGADVYGGRLQMHLGGIGADSPGLFGATFVRQNQGLRSFNLYGADALLPLGAGGSLIAEYARSENGSELLGNVSGTAYRVEAEGRFSPAVQARAYWRSVGTGFANDATVSFVPGQTRMGAQVTAAVGAKTHLRAQIDHETDKGIAPLPATDLAGQLDPGTTAAQGVAVDNSLTTLSAGVEQRVGKADLSVDMIGRDRTDNIAPGTLAGRSSQLQTRLSAPIAPRVSFLAQSDVTLSHTVDAVETDRTLLGVRYAVSPGVDLRLNQQFFGRGQYSGHSATSLDIGVQRPWSDGDLSERFSITGGMNGISVQQSLGLGRRWTLAPGLRMSVGYEKISGSFLGRTQAGPQTDPSYAVGQSAASLGFSGAQSESVGLEYTRPADFKASARLENRTSSGGSNLVVTAAAAGKVSPALTSLFTYQQARASNPGLESLGRSVTLRLGLAYRDPASDKWNGLLRYEYRLNPASTPDTILVGSGTGSRENVLAAEGIYAPQWQWELYGKVAVRDSASYLASDYVASSRLSLAQLRATYRWRRNMDVLAEGRWISEPAAGYGNRGEHVEVGYYVSPDLRLGVGYSFGRLDDPDFNGTHSEGGFTLGLTAKVDQLFGGFGVQRDAFDAPATTGTAANAAATKQTR